MSIKEITTFIDQNRQLGSTTRLVDAAVAADGYLIVHSVGFRDSLLQVHPSLKRERVFTVNELKAGRARGLPPRPVFVDAALLCSL